MEPVSSRLRIVQYPHPALRHKAAPVTSITKELTLQIGQMLDLMYENKGLGLAAPQVALPVQVFVMNFEGDPQKKELEYVAINPVILEQKGSIDDREGCLSFPDLFAKVRRARTVKVQAYNLKGEAYEMVLSELPARIWQHELDHLLGVLFIDKLGFLGRMNVRKELDEFIKQFNEQKKKGDLPSDMEPRL
jgi:peptide deformylase